MQKPPPQPPQYGENIAGRMFDVARQLQKNREEYASVRRPTPLAQKVSQGQDVINALTKKQQDEQGQNASSTPGTPQEERSEEQGRKRNVRPGEEEGRIR
jgi:hypothetical protein